MDIYQTLYYLVGFDALLVLVMGLVAAGMFLFGAKFDLFRERVIPAVIALVATGLGAGLIMWIGTKLFT